MRQETVWAQGNGRRRSASIGPLRVLAAHFAKCARGLRELQGQPVKCRWFARGEDDLPAPTGKRRLEFTTSPGQGQRGLRLLEFPLDSGRAPPKMKLVLVHPPDGKPRLAGGRSHRRKHGKLGSHMTPAERVSTTP